MKKKFWEPDKWYEDDGVMFIIVYISSMVLMIVILALFGNKN